MVSLFAVLLLIVVWTSSAWADDPRVGDERSSEDVLASPRRTADKSLWIVGATLNSAMLLDTMSTFDALGRCSQCVEGNPIVAPIVNRGPVVAYTAGLLFDAGVMTIAARMKTSARPRLRKAWWIAPVALASAHLIAYRHNLNIAK